MTSSRVVDTNGSGHGALAGFLAAHRVEALICGGIGSGARAALAELGQEPAVGHVTDPARIAAYGVMSTPALVVDGKVVSYGKALTKDEARTVIAKARGVE